MLLNKISAIINFHKIQLGKPIPWFKWLSPRELLTIKSTQVDNINNTVMEPIPGDMVSLYSIDSVAEEYNLVLYNSEFFNSLNLNSLPPLKITKHYYFKYCCSDVYYPHNCNKLKCTSNGEIMYTPRITMLIIRLLWKYDQYYRWRSTGAKDKKCGSILSTCVFTHRKLYIAASRVRDSSTQVMHTQPSCSWT